MTAKITVSELQGKESNTEEKNCDGEEGVAWGCHLLLLTYLNNTNHTKIIY